MLFISLFIIIVLSISMGILIYRYNKKYNCSLSSVSNRNTSCPVQEKCPTCPVQEKCPTCPDSDWTDDRKQELYTDVDTLISSLAFEHYGYWLNSPDNNIINCIKMELANHIKWNDYNSLIVSNAGLNKPSGITTKLPYNYFVDNFITISTHTIAGTSHSNYTYTCNDFDQNLWNKYLPK